jgi:UDP-N-acetylmuramate dehydrogenase
MTFAVQENVPLARLTTIKIGGAARFFVRADNETDVVKALEFAKQNELQIFVLGGGSNVLIADEGFDGLVLQIALKGISVSQEKCETVRVNAGAGEDWEKFVAFCVEKNLQGIECLSGIPGTVGGTPVQNVGAYGQEVAETIVAVRCFDRHAKEFVDLSNGQCGFAYRTSIFNTTEKNRFIVLSVSFALKKDGAPKIVYKDLQNFFAGKQPTLKETRQAVLEIRRAKSMVVDERDINSRSVGSFFKNPFVSKKQFAEIEARARQSKIIAATENLPNYVVDENNVKIPAAWLIEKSGFGKGYKSGRVGLSVNHTLAIVNLGGATACDVSTLKTEIQTKVKETFGIEIKPEPIFVGFENT